MKDLKFPKDETIATLIQDASTEIDVFNSIIGEDKPSPRELALFRAAIVFKTRSTAVTAKASSPIEGNRFKHEADNLFEAVGLDGDEFPEKVKAYVKKMAIEAIENDGKMTKSRQIEIATSLFSDPIEIATAVLITKDKF
jgi:hypothetical protein